MTVSRIVLYQWVLVEANPEGFSAGQNGGSVE